MPNESSSIESIVDSSIPKRDKNYWMKIFTVNSFNHELFPFVVGLYQQVKRDLKGRLVFLCRDHKESEFYENLFYNVFRELPSNIPRPSLLYPERRRISFSSQQVMTIVNELTKNNTQPPYQIINTTERTVNYLKGLFHNSAIVSYSSKVIKRTGTRKKWPRVVLNLFQGKKRLEEEVENVLEKLGVFARHYRNGLIILARNSFQKAVEIGILDKKSESKLVDLLDEIDSFWGMASLRKEYVSDED